MLDTNELAKIENSSVMAFAPQVPGDLARIFKSIGERKESKGLLYVLLLTIASIGVGFFIVRGAELITQKRNAPLKQMFPPNNDSVACLWAGFVRSVPDLTSLALLPILATVIFLFFAGDVTIKGRMLFQLALGIVLAVRVSCIVGRIIFAPGDARVRPLALGDSVAKPLYPHGP